MLLPHDCEVSGARRRFHLLEQRLVKKAVLQLRAALLMVIDHLIEQLEEYFRLVIRAIWQARYHALREQVASVVAAIRRVG
jgi:hypothetical protein